MNLITLLCLIVKGEGAEQNTPGGKLSQFLKMGGGVLLGHSLIIIKRTWGFFPQNMQFDSSNYNPAQKSPFHNGWYQNAIQT